MNFQPDAEIDHEGPVTPYRQLAGILRARIERGDWQPNRPIASETQLVQQYGLARTTVRRAIAALVEEGLVFTVPQRGTYVAPEATAQPQLDVDNGQEDSAEPTPPCQ